MLKIGIDAMGGDYAPSAVVRGALLAAPALSSECEIVLFGDRNAIERTLREENQAIDAFRIVATTEVIGMADHPAQAFSKKTDSSIAVGFRQLAAGQIDGFASAGSTGAMLVGCMHAVKLIDGVIRPGISTTVPTLQGGQSLLMDIGLNIDCKPEVLAQYAVIGSVYARSVLGIEDPRVGLLNIGEEKEKGNIQTKAAYELMEGADTYRFIGNIEAKELYTGRVADVIICDGFVGNTVLKLTESIFEIAQARGIRDAYLEQFNYENVGGTPVLGIQAPVVIGHGCSSPPAIKNMILQTEQTIRAGLINRLREIFN